MSYYEIILRLKITRFSMGSGNNHVIVKLFQIIFQCVQYAGANP